MYEIAIYTNWKWNSSETDFEINARKPTFPIILFQHREKLGKKMEKYVKKREDMVAQGVVSTVKPV